MLATGLVAKHGIEAGLQISSYIIAAKNCSIWTVDSEFCPLSI